MSKLHLQTQGDSDHLTMALACNNNNIQYYHIDTTQSIAFAHTYFAHHAYLVVQSWVHATYLFPDTVYQTGPHIYCNFFWGGWATCPWHSVLLIMAKIDQSHAAMPFVVTAFTAI